MPFPKYPTNIKNFIRYSLKYQTGTCILLLATLVLLTCCHCGKVQTFYLSPSKANNLYPPKLAQPHIPYLLVRLFVVLLLVRLVLEVNARHLRDHARDDATAVRGSVPQQLRVRECVHRENVVRARSVTRRITNKYGVPYLFHTLLAVAHGLVENLEQVHHHGQRILIAVVDWTHHYDGGGGGLGRII